jgi:hypothetical protein
LIETLPSRNPGKGSIIQTMSKDLVEGQGREEQQESAIPKKYPRHPITMENTPEETIRIMQAFPERAAKIRELIRGLRETDAC